MLVLKTRYHSKIVTYIYGTYGSNTTSDPAGSNVVVTKVLL